MGLDKVIDVATSMPRKVETDYVQVKVRTVDHIVKRTDGEYCIWVKEGSREMHLALFPVTHPLGETLKPGDQFIHVTSNGDTRLVYGPVIKENLYIAGHKD